MASTAEIRKSYTDFAKTLSGPKPLYAVAGVGDLAVEKVKNFRLELTKGDTPVKDKATKLPKQVADKISDLPAEAKKLSTKLTDLADEQVKAADARYAKLADRGESIVKRVRTQKSTKDLLEQAKSTVSRARSVRGAATNGAKNTRTAAKSTVTSARKTATRAKAATTDASAKVGD
jgi:heparin binding hemagglutinin HbhA